ncbi:alpha-L-fucosidase [Novipirellula artificiosorum]|uniref:alpha-L-fucosidase n=1 Tax=Novipirellula artificiosorum TaxID=2528016 RepID=A0A5C6DHA9_9BACT|nr:alpha-L-fucosidase [Novipirellula artificiosorum]TWU36038.1 Alpha-L-fucosidase [Novipirellula artificiosorum]
MFFQQVLSVFVVLAALGHVQLHAQTDETLNLERGLVGRDDLVYFCNFETDDWSEDWSGFGHRKNVRLVDSNLSEHLTSDWDGRCLEVEIRKGEHYGASGKLLFKKHLGYEPEELYVRFYTCFAEDFVGRDGSEGYRGKNPGFDGTYDVEGWGGRPNSDGTKGWSCRGACDADNDSQQIHLGFYSYEVKTGDYKYGTTLKFNKPIKPGNWYCVEQYLKLNTPGKADGIARAWIDGEPVFEKSDYLWRNTDKLKIESYWVDYYRGGKTPASHDHHVYLDNLAIATEKRLGEFTPPLKRSVDTDTKPHRASSPKLSRESLLDFVNTRYHAYFHYNMCTFKNIASDEPQGRAYGDDPATLWSPTGLDCDQWAQVCIDSKMAGGWLTTKHHGGFCLWDSQATDYDVASSNVKTDVVKEFTDAFRKRGLKIGLYYSILDYHHGVENGEVTREEIEFLKVQLRELLTNYGPIDYMNFDGWSTWPTTPDFDDVPYAELYQTVKAIQPDCLIVNHTYESNLAHADVPFADAAGRRYPFHPDYLRPTAASDTLQRGWWWDNNEDYGVRKSVDYILKQLDSYNSHHSVYVLNVSPNSGGRLPDDAVQRLTDAAKQWTPLPPLTEAGSNWGFQYEVGNNLAFHCPAAQSSTHDFIRDKRAYPRAEIALDGVTEGNGLMEQTSMTAVEDHPWWQVDLTRSCVIEQIDLFGRTDLDTSEQQTVVVSILDAQGSVAWQKTIPMPTGDPTILEPGRLSGSKVRIELVGNGSLAIAEVIVRGEPAR